VMRKSRLLKCMCAPRVQLTPWLAIRGLGVDVETRKRPLPGTTTVDVSYHQLVNLYYVFGPDGVLEDTRIYTGFGKTSLRLVRDGLCY
jgi:hypothetical protein